MLSTRLKVLVLQHPQEPDHLLGTAPLLIKNLEKATIKVALSCKNLAQALGSQAVIDPKKWLVLYLGSGVKQGNSGPPPTGKDGRIGREGAISGASGDLMIVDKKGQSIRTAEAAAIARGLEGVVVLDGTWSQGKTLWWRNAWLLKLQRGILFAREPSLYGKLRKEPRRECLSTLESVAYTLDLLGEDPKVKDTLLGAFKAMLAEKKK